MRTLLFVLIALLSVSCASAQLVKPGTSTSSTDQTARDTANAAMALARTKLDTASKFSWEYTAQRTDSIIFLAGTGITLSQSTTSLTISAANVPRSVPAYSNDTTQFLRGDSSWVTPAAAGLGDITAVTAGSGITGGGASGAVTINWDSSSTVANLALKAPLASPTFTGTVTLPVGLTGTVRATAGVVTATASDTVGLAVALAAKALAATTITASTGLTGGGSLASNRTLAIDSTSLVATDYDVSLKLDKSALDDSVDANTVAVQTSSGYVPRDSSNVLVNGQYHVPQVLLASITLDSSCQFTSDTTAIGYVQYKSVIDTIILYSNSTVSLTPRFLIGSTPAVTSPAAFTTARTATRISTFDASAVAARTMLHLVLDAITSKATKLSVYIYGHPVP